MSLDREELQLRLDLLRRELPEGAPVVAIPTLRARDRSEIHSGLVFDLGLASSALGTPFFGTYVLWTGAQLHVLRGMLGVRELSTLAPVLEDTSSLIVADEVDEAVLASVIADRPSGGRLVLLTPTSSVPDRGIDALARALKIRAAVLRPRLDLSPAKRLTLLATCEALAVFGELPGAAPLGLMYLGGAELAEATARARLARELLRG